MPLTIDSSVRVVPNGQTATILKISGSLDTNTAEQANDAFAGIVATAPKTLVVDLAGLEFIDSSGISSLLLARTELRKVGTSIVMTNMPRPIKRVFDIVKALPGVALFNSLDELDEYLARIQAEEKAK